MALFSFVLFSGKICGVPINSPCKRVVYVCGQFTLIKRKSMGESTRVTVWKCIMKTNFVV